MRYLLFNLLIVGALAFLLFDGESPTMVQDAVDKVAAKADRLVVKGKALIRPAKTERLAQQTSPNTHTLQPEAVTQAIGSHDESVAMQSDIVAHATELVTKPAPAAVDKIAVELDQLVARGKALIGPTETGGSARRTSPVTSTPQTPSSPQSGGSRERSVAVPPDIEHRGTAFLMEPPLATSTPGTASPRATKPREVSDVVIRGLDPAVARRRAEILGEVPDGAVDAPAATPEFMSSRLRRGELHKLAEDMELMFVEKAGR